MITDFDRAYAAGYIDGDGCFYLGAYMSTKSMIYEYSVQVPSTKKESVDWLKEKFGGSIRTISDSREIRKTIHHWKLSGKKSIEFVKQIQPFIVAKQVESQIYIEYGLNVVRNNFQPLTDDTIEHRMDLIKNIRKEKHEWNQITKDEFTSKWKTITPSIEITDIDIAYFAGLIDSEGCFRVKKWKPQKKPNNVYMISLEIGNTQKLFFEWILNRFGGSISFLTAKAKNRKNSVTWSLGAKKLNVLALRIVRFLIIKQPVCKKIIEFQQTMIPNGGDRHSDTFKNMYQKVISKREKIISEIHILNKKGHSKSS